VSASLRIEAPALPAGFLEAPATALDIDAIAAIEGNEFPIPWRRDYFAQELAQPQRYNRVLRRIEDSTGNRFPREEVVGYFFSSYLLDEMHINKIATRHDLWGQGLARHLLARALEFAHARGVRLLTLEVRISNARAVDFYARHGFDPAYVRKEYYQDGEDALVMHKTLPG